MIKMNPTLYKLQARCQPALVGTRPGAEVDDLQDAAETTAVDQIVDQLGEEGADGGEAGRGVGGDAGGKPAGVDGDLCWRFRYPNTADAEQRLPQPVRGDAGGEPGWVNGGLCRRYR